MEVHHHSHSPRQKLTHYIWEFFMLFLAVSAGFFVENQREHYIEGKREIKYIEAIVEDLKSDTAWINQFLVDQQWSVNAYDSVILLLNKETKDQYTMQRLYYLVRMAMRMSWPNEVNQTAYDQLKNSGNMRLIHDHDIGDSIAEYYFFVREIGYITELLTLRQQAVTEYEAKLIDGNILRSMIDANGLSVSMPDGYPLLITEDKMVINEFLVRVHYLSSIMIYSINFAKQQSRLAIDLLGFLNEEYHLE